MPFSTHQYLLCNLSPGANYVAYRSPFKLFVGEA